jgi:hypothetical protein
VTNLADVKTLYIRPVSDEFDSALQEQMEHELSGRLEIVKSARKADAVLSVAIVDSHGNRLSGAAGRVTGLKGSKKAVATMTDSWPHAWPSGFGATCDERVHEVFRMETR